MSAGAAGAAAAAARQRREREEEESLTTYTRTELEEGWEFKILRSATSTFKNPDRFRDALAQEARAGWIMVEKFDNGRVRLKRPVSARELDAGLDFDPYRSHYGTSEATVVMCIVGGIVLLIAVMIGVAITIAKLRSTP